MSDAERGGNCTLQHFRDIPEILSQPEAGAWPFCCRYVPSTIASPLRH